MLGQVATFMEALHLTRREVVEEIPYRTLLIMSRDKLHVATGDVWREMTPEEFEQMKKAKMK